MERNSLLLPGQEEAEAVKIEARTGRCMIEGYRGVYELSADGMTGGFALSRGCAAQDVTVR